MLRSCTGRGAARRRHHSLTLSAAAAHRHRHQWVGMGGAQPVDRSRRRAQGHGTGGDERQGVAASLLQRGQSHRPCESPEHRRDFRSRTGGRWLPPSWCSSCSTASPSIPRSSAKATSSRRRCSMWWRVWHARLISPISKASSTVISSPPTSFCIAPPPEAWWARSSILASARCSPRAPPISRSPRPVRWSVRQRT